jgi:glycosyltransferase 2 family protein
MDRRFRQPLIAPAATAAPPADARSEPLSGGRPAAPGRSSRFWPVLKILLTLAVLAAVGWEFARILRRPELWERPLNLHPGWLAASAGLYLVGLGFSAMFWYGLLRSVGERPSLLAAVRAYYVGQLGRYVPGKVWGLVLRATLVTGPGVRTGVAGLTAVYEALITPAAGALVGAVLFLALRLGSLTEDWETLAALGFVGLLIVPPVFNWLVDRVSGPFRADQAALPRLRLTALAVGLALTACGWAVQGASLWALLRGLLPDLQGWDATAWAHCTAYVGLAYLLGYLAVFLPGGLGVREFFLQRWLARELAGPLGAGEAAALAVVAALLLRLIWTVAEAGCAAAVYWLPGQRRAVAV